MARGTGWDEKPAFLEGAVLRFRFPSFRSRGVFCRGAACAESALTSKRVHAAKRLHLRTRERIENDTGHVRHGWGVQLELRIAG